MPIAALEIPRSDRIACRMAASLQYTRNQARYTGSISAPQPIVGISFMRCGNDLHWARSRKAQEQVLPFDLLLGAYTAEAKETLYVTWSIGNGQVQRGFANRSIPPLPDSIDRQVHVGEFFHFADIGSDVSLFGLVLLRSQVQGKRNHLWGLRETYTANLSAPWKNIMVYGRTGTTSWN
jgi:hypothetical protein